jgi:hypothetical protein
VARDLNTVLCFGVLGKDADIVYNTQVVSGEGSLGTQSKIHVLGSEYLHCRDGSVIETIDNGMARIGMMIC